MDTRALYRDVAAHYGRQGLLETIVDGLRAAGVDPMKPSIDDLAPVDEFHTAGRIATIKALELTPIAREMHVLDAGCGIGGTARYLAKTRGCRVTGVDLTPEYVEVARALTERTGLSDACSFETASVVDLPFEDGAFDAAYSFHVAMNVSDRAGFYGELARVLAPRAPLCIFDVMKGPADGMVYPVPWAETEVTSFLKSPEETGRLLEAAGFELHLTESVRGLAVDYFRQAFNKIAERGGPPPVGLHLLTGANSSAKFANYVRALEARQIDPVIMVAARHA